MGGKSYRKLRPGMSCRILREKQIPIISLSINCFARNHIFRFSFNFSISEAMSLKKKGKQLSSWLFFGRVDVCKLLSRFITHCPRSEVVFLGSFRLSRFLSRHTEDLTCGRERSKGNRKTGTIPSSFGKAYPMQDSTHL